MMIVNYFRKYPYALAVIVIMLIWMTINGIQSGTAKKRLAEDGVFTLATITDIDGARSGRWVEVKFFYNGREYKTKRRNETIPHSWIGEKIFIKFLPSRPVESEYYDRIEVPDSFKQLSSPIWEDLPIDTSFK